MANEEYRMWIQGIVDSLNKTINDARSIGCPVRYDDDKKYDIVFYYNEEYDKILVDKSFELGDDRAKPTISDEDWAEAIKYIDSLILLYSGIGPSGMFGLSMLSQLKTRYENGERTQELYDSIMSCE